MSNVPSAAPLENDQPLLDALSALHRLSAALNHFGAGDDASVHIALRLIVDGVVQLVPGASALIILYDESADGFDPASQVSSGGPRTSLNAACLRESICFPLLAADQPVGALHVCLNDERTFGQGEFLMLEILVSHAAMALYQARRLAGVCRVGAHSAAEWRRPWSGGMPAGARCREPGCVTMLPASAPAVGPATKESFAAEQCHEQCARGVGAAPALAAGWSELDVLTDREREVLALLAEGMTNKQIAAVLVITPNTVKRHLKAIFEKLGIRTRTAAAAKAISARFPAF